MGVSSPTQPFAQLSCQWTEVRPPFNPSWIAQECEHPLGHQRRENPRMRHFWGCPENTAKSVLERTLAGSSSPWPWTQARPHTDTCPPSLCRWAPVSPSGCSCRSTWSPALTASRFKFKTEMVTGGLRTLLPASKSDSGDRCDSEDWLCHFGYVKWMRRNLQLWGCNNYVGNTQYSGK